MIDAGLLFLNSMKEDHCSLWAFFSLIRSQKSITEVTHFSKYCRFVTIIDYLTVVVYLAKVEACFNNIEFWKCCRKSSKLTINFKKGPVIFKLQQIYCSTFKFKMKYTIYMMPCYEHTLFIDYFLLQILQFICLVNIQNKYMCSVFVTFLPLPVYH